MKTKRTVALVVGLLALVEVGYVVAVKTEAGRAIVPAVADLLVGRDVDNVFLQVMIARQKTAIALAEREIALGDNPKAVAIARQMLAVRQNELAALETADHPTR